MDYAHVNEVPLANIQVLHEELKDIPFQVSNTSYLISNTKEILECIKEIFVLVRS